MQHLKHFIEYLIFVLIGALAFRLLIRGEMTITLEDMAFWLFLALAITLGNVVRKRKTRSLDEEA